MPLLLGDRAVCADIVRFYVFEKAQIFCFGSCAKAATFLGSAVAALDMGVRVMCYVRFACLGERGPSLDI